MDELIHELEHKRYESQIKSLQLDKYLGQLRYQRDIARLNKMNLVRTRDGYNDEHFGVESGFDPFG